MISHTSNRIRVRGVGVVDDGVCAGDRNSDAQPATSEPTPSSGAAPIRLLTPPETVTLINSAPVNGYYQRPHRAGRRRLGFSGTASSSEERRQRRPTPPAAGVWTRNGNRAAYFRVRRLECTDRMVSSSRTRRPPTQGLRNLAKRHVPDPTARPKPFTLDDDAQQHAELHRQHICRRADDEDEVRNQLVV